MLTDERIKRFKQYKDNVDPRYETMLCSWLEEGIAEITALRMQLKINNEAYNLDKLMFEEGIKKLHSQLASMPTEPWRPLQQSDKTGRLFLAQTCEGVELIFWSGQYFWDTHGAPYRDCEILAVAQIVEEEA